MTPATPANADAAAPPAGELRVDVYRADKTYRGEVTGDAAEKIVANRLGEWIGGGNRRRIRLLDIIKDRNPATWRGGLKTTRRAKNDAGGWIGPGPSTQEHKPLA